MSSPSEAEKKLIDSNVLQDGEMEEFARLVVFFSIRERLNTLLELPSLKDQVDTMADYPVDLLAELLAMIASEAKNGESKYERLGLIALQCMYVRCTDVPQHVKDALRSFVQGKGSPGALSTLHDYISEGDDSRQAMSSPSTTTQQTEPQEKPSMARATKQAELSLNDKAKNEVITAEVVRLGDKISIPEAMPLPAAIKTLEEVMRDEETLIRVSEKIDCYPWEGAIAFRKAIEEMFGYSRTKGTPSFFGEIPPSEITVETGVDQRTTAPWGRFQFALAESSDEYLETDSAMKDGRVIFEIGGVVKKKYKDTIMKLAALTRQYVKKESIYRGQALRINFTNQDGSPIAIPTPSFLDLSSVNLEELVYTRSLTDLMEHNVLTPIRHSDICRASGIPLKRGVLLAGPYGTGKTLFARGVAKVAVEHDWTFIYIRNSSELPRAIQFASQYQPAVIFAEDVDRNVTGERTDAMDSILNTLDGIDSKHTDIMTILTTNHLDKVNPAMLRPGRLDVILSITPPDAEAVERLIRAYGRNVLEADADLTAAGMLLANQTPAIVREVVERAKLSTIARTGSKDGKVNGDDLRIAAETMVQQQRLLTPAPAEAKHWGEDMAKDITTMVTEQVHDKLKANSLGTVERGVKRIAQYHGISVE